MARINIEDSLFRDNRFFNLAMKLGSKTMALGAVVELYIVAQEYWKKDRSLMPKQVWVEQGLNNALIEVGFVEEKDHGFYVKNSENLFGWLLSKVKNGQKGGSAQKLLTCSNFNNLDESELKRIEAIESKSKPLTLTLTHTPSQELINNIPRNAKKASSEKINPVDEKLDDEYTHEFLKLVSPETQKGWLITYQDHDFIRHELKKAVIWIHDNSHKKPKSNFGKFFSSWLSRNWESHRKNIPSQKTKNNFGMVQDF